MGGRHFGAARLADQGKMIMADLKMTTGGPVKAGGIIIHVPFGVVALISAFISTTGYAIYFFNGWQCPLKTAHL